MVAISGGRALTATAQNLIPNGSFEEQRECPIDFSAYELKTLNHWRQGNGGTPDHFSECAAGSRVGVPENLFGFQPALDGKAYVGLVLYSKSNESYREYLHAQLSRALKKGEWVCVEWWVCAADHAKFTTDGLGVHFGPKRLSGFDLGALNFQAQVQNPLLNILSDRWSWMKLSDAFQAKGGEQFVTIGNFHEMRDVRVLERRDAPEESKDWAYVYLDDFKAFPVGDPSECSCLNNSIEENVTDPPWQVYQREQIKLDAILFDFDSFELTESAQNQIEELASEMRSNRFLVIEVNGHTDFIGPDDYNMTLSEQRAQSVLNALKERGIDPARLKLSWHGSQLPAADNSTSQGRQQNRRVEFELLEHAFLPTN
ncbi:MAG: OmpA family protein [Bacteroidetes bacterium]|nr:OmpA family protein [Bacteroidota bacterium]MDA1336656.1 OmpA family protein [Bacteroidota bacterium]